MVALQVIDQRADFRFARRIDSDQRDGMMNVLSAIFEAQHAVDFNRRGDACDIFADQLLYDSLMQFRIQLAIVVAGFDDDVGENPLDSHPHFTAEACHHGIDHNHRGDAKSHADDTRQSDVTSSQVPLTQKQFVHEPVLWLVRIAVQPRSNLVHFNRSSNSRDGSSYQS